MALQKQDIGVPVTLHSDPTLFWSREDTHTLQLSLPHLLIVTQIKIYSLVVLPVIALLYETDTWPSVNCKLEFQLL